ncbi:hypothetical protein H6801_00335 [Candidatus Nomurabacteria bacterium]|nr:hypothetical protein [Candidatus Saccharibacteria bacterium]MCA9313224.1 hypothetical protein [Candidatus Saccharibacteria bacterium]MCB9821809.1 hypothetical protein [Candidatus Nomurabacteria bacterium]
MSGAYNNPEHNSLGEAEDAERLVVNDHAIEWALGVSTRFTAEDPDCIDHELPTEVKPVPRTKLPLGVVIDLETGRYKN